MARKIVRKPSKEAPAKVVSKKAPKKVAKKSPAKRSPNGQSIDLTQFLLPGILVFVITWAFTGSITLGIIIFFGVLAGNWFGQTYKNKKRS